MPQGSPKSVMAVDNPSHLTGSYAHNAPRVQRQYTWRDPNQTQEERRNTSRGYNQNSNTRGGKKRRKKRRNKSRKKKGAAPKGSAPVYGISGYVVGDPQQYTFKEAKEKKIKNIWEGSKEKGKDIQVKDPFGFEAFKEGAQTKGWDAKTNPNLHKKYLSKKGGKRKSRKKSRRKSRKKSRRKSRKGKKKRKSRRKLSLIHI